MGPHRVHQGHIYTTLAVGKNLLSTQRVKTRRLVSAHYIWQRDFDKSKIPEERPSKLLHENIELALKKADQLELVLN